MGMTPQSQGPGQPQPGAPQQMMQQGGPQQGGDLKGVLLPIIAALLAQSGQQGGGPSMPGGGGGMPATPQGQAHQGMGQGHMGAQAPLAMGSSMANPTNPALGQNQMRR